MHEVIRTMKPLKRLQEWSYICLLTLKMFSESSLSLVSFSWVCNPTSETRNSHLSRSSFVCPSRTIFKMNILNAKYSQELHDTGSTLWEMSSSVSFEKESKHKGNFRSRMYRVQMSRQYALLVLWVKETWLGRCCQAWGLGEPSPAGAGPGVSVWPHCHLAASGPGLLTEVGDCHPGQWPLPQGRFPLGKKERDVHRRRLQRPHRGWHLSFQIGSFTKASGFSWINLR